MAWRRKIDVPIIQLAWAVVYENVLGQSGGFRFLANRFSGQFQMVFQLVSTASMDIWLLVSFVWAEAECQR